MNCPGLDQLSHVFESDIWDFNKKFCQFLQKCCQEDGIFPFVIKGNYLDNSDTLRIWRVLVNCSIQTPSSLTLMLKNFKKAQKSVSVIRDQTLFMDVMLTIQSVECRMTDETLLRTYFKGFVQAFKEKVLTMIYFEDAL